MTDADLFKIRIAQSALWAYGQLYVFNRGTLVVDRRIDLDCWWFA